MANAVSASSQCTPTGMLDLHPSAKKDAQLILGRYESWMITRSASRPGTIHDLIQLFHWNGIHFDHWGQVDCIDQNDSLKWIMDIYDDTVPQCDGDRSRLNVDLMLRRRGLEWHRFLMVRKWGGRSSSMSA